MRKRFLISLAATVLLVSGMLLLARLFPSTIRFSVSDDGAGDDVMPLSVSDECRFACERLAMCRHPLAGEQCAPFCEAAWNFETRRCVQESACRDINDLCLAELAAVDCAAACEKAEECGLVVPGEDCIELCSEQWDRDLRECLIVTACDEVEAVCLPAIEPTACSAFCDRLAECDLLGENGDADCLESCLTVDDPELRDCVARVACPAIELVCMADDFDPLCLEACERLDACDELGDIDPEFCPVLCLEAWGDVTLACLLDSNCVELGPVCLGRPDPICADVCYKLMECGLESEYDDCALTCSTSLGEQLRQCILDAPCGQIDDVCFGVQPDLCAVVCEKLVNCELDDDFDVCYEACDAAPDLDLIRCILAHPCEDIVENCS